MAMMQKTMDHLKFLAMVPFMYNGHFQLMKRTPLVYCKAGTWEQNMSVHDEVHKTWWPVGELDEQGFNIVTQSYGRVDIRFSECKWFAGPWFSPYAFQPTL